MSSACPTVSRRLLTFTVVVAAVLLLSCTSCSAFETSCKQGHQCLLLTSCLSLHRVFLTGSPNQRLRVIQLTCGFQGREEKVCCPRTKTDVSTNSTGSPPTTRTPKPSAVPPKAFSTTRKPQVVPPKTTITLTTPKPSSVLSIDSSSNQFKDGVQATETASSPDSPPTSFPNSSLLPSDCGQPAPPDKIYGGTAAHLGAFPWMALLGYTFPGSSPSDPPEWQCGGSLINSRYVLTAAHCTDRNVPLTTVRLGENLQNSSPDCNSAVCAPDVQDFSPVAVCRHPWYNSKRRGFLSDDVALIRLDRPAQMSAFVQPVCLPAPHQSIEDVVGDREVTVSGWGEVSPNVRSEQLLKVALPLVPLSQCRAIRFYQSKLRLDKGQTCLGGEGGKDSCSMDSGGPAVVPTGQHHVQYVQVGIVSYGTRPCALKGLPGVYTDVAAYRDWIVHNMQH